MSYDIRLKDPVTDETLDLPLKHVMTSRITTVTITMKLQTEIPDSLTMKSLPTMQMGQQALLKQNMASAEFTVRQGQKVLQCWRI